MFKLRVHKKKKLEWKRAHYSKTNYVPLTRLTKLASFKRRGHHHRWPLTDLIARFMADVSARKRFPFRFSEFRYSPLEIVTNFWQTERYGIRVIKFKTAEFTFYVTPSLWLFLKLPNSLHLMKKYELFKLFEKDTLVNVLMHEFEPVQEEKSLSEWLYTSGNPLRLSRLFGIEISRLDLKKVTGAV